MSIPSTRPVNVPMAVSTATGSGQRRSRLRSPSPMRRPSSSSSESRRPSMTSGPASRVRFYVTDLTTDDAGIEHLFRLVHGHWSIENGLHWVRGVTFGEDLSQVRTGTLSRILATLRNLAIGMIRHTTYRSVNIAASTRQLARQPDVALDILGIPRGLCK